MEKKEEKAGKSEGPQQEARKEPTQKEMEEAFYRFLDDVTGQGFEELWSRHKDKLREMSKKELSQVSFFEGSRFMYSFMQQASAQQAEAEAKAALSKEGASVKGDVQKKAD